MKKVLSLLAVMALVLGMFSSTAMACSKSPDCYSNGVKYTCGSVRTNYGSHQVKYPNGNSQTCKVSYTSGPHKKSCTGCGATLGTVSRACSEMHSDSHCFDKRNMCK